MPAIARMARSYREFGWLSVSGYFRCPGGKAG